MGKIVGGFLLPHDPLVFANPQQLDRDDILAAYAEIATRIVALKADTAIIVGADHYILFGPSCLPQFVIGIGNAHGPIDPLPGVDNGPIPTHPTLARHIVDEGLASGFDWAVSKAMAVDHAVGVPVRMCLPADGSVATVPIYIAAGVEPFLPKRRAYELGRSIGHAVASFEQDCRVVVIASGGISHWVGTREMGQINEVFDQMVLDATVHADAEQLIALNDAEVLATAGNGAFEIRQLICAMGATGSVSGRVIAYSPWPGAGTGLGFAELEVAA